MIGVAAWTCPSCRGVVSTPYCPGCGERPLQPRELTLHGLASQAFEALTDVDGRLLRSLRSLVTQPGLLTVAYSEGCRKPFIGPVSLFLTTNLLFFAIETMSGGTVFAAPLQGHLHTQPWSETAGPLVLERLQALNIPLEMFAPRFDAAVATHARTLILLMTICFAPVPAVIFRRRRHPFAVHAVFSLHLYGFILLTLTAGTLVPAAGMVAGGVRSTSETLDHVLTIALLAVIAAYLYKAVGVVYGGRPSARLLQAAALTSTTAAIVLGYRFGLFLLALYTS
jgi:Protein of unknown function (DUF3667)